jgi:hypothetical protein
MKAYVYQIIVDGVVRYIGKGTGKRAMSHITIARSIIRRRAAGETVRATHFQNRLAKAYRDGADIQIEIVAGGLSDASAFDLEMVQIATHRQLWNMTAGGEKPPRATKRSPEFIAKVTASNKARWADPELRQRQSSQKKIHWLRPEYRRAFSEAARHSSDAKRTAAKTRWADPDFRARAIAAMKRTKSNAV